MASAWGLSWGLAWGNSWGIVGDFEEPAPAPAPPRKRGGGRGHPFLRRRVEPEVEKIIEEVAKRQVEDLHLDETQRIQELIHELEARNLESRKYYVKLLEQHRELLIDQEIKQRLQAKLKQRLDEEEAIITIILSNLQ